MTGGGRRPLPLRAALLLAALGLLAPACRDRAPEPSASPGPAAPQAASDAGAPRPLAAGDSVEREIGPADVHRYRIELPADRALRVTAHQQGGGDRPDVDLELTLTGPDGAGTVADRPIGASGFEELLVAGEGVHELAVRQWTDPEQAAHGGALPGRYEIVAEGLPAGEETPVRVAAERACEWAVANMESAGVDERAEVHDAFTRCIAGLGEVGDLGRQARAHRDLAVALGEWGEPLAARLEHLELAGRLYAEAGEPQAAFEAELRKGRAQASEEGAHGAAIATLWTLVARLDAEEHTETLAGALGILGEIYSRIGAWDDALDVLQRAKELPTRSSCEQMNRIAQWAVVFSRIGAYERARQPLDEAIAMGEELRCRPHDRSVILYQRGRVALAAEEYPEAADYAARALELGGQRRRALTRLFQGQVAIAAGRLDLAEEALSEARRLYARNPRAVAVCDLSLAELARERGEHGAAVEIYRRVSGYARQQEDRTLEASALLGTARTQLLDGDLQAALATVQRGLAVVEEMRRVPSGPTLRAELLASQHALYDLHVDVLMRLGRDARALHACEQARARSLLESLSGEAGETSERARRLRERIGEIEARLVLDPEGDGAAAQRAALDELDIELERARARARPAPATGRVLSAEEIRRTVDEGDLYLSFHLGEERSYLWLVDRRRVDGYELPARAEIERLARDAYDAVLASYSRRRRERAQRALADLSAALLGVAADRLAGGERLLVVPEGELLYVPFAALPLPGDGRRLIDAHELVVLPSASALAELRRRLGGRPPVPGMLAAVADPVFAAGDPRLAGLPGGVRSPRRSGEELSRLPHTAGEVEAILELLPDGAETRVLLGFEATAGAVRGGELSGYRYVHLATHAQLAGDDPRLVFSLFRADGTPDPRSTLHSRDLYDLRLPAELVVLSACSTGLGERIEGEGLVGFSQGFFTAGARRLMVSLWEVSDESTAELMRLFYEAHFRRGLPPAAALREAQRRMSRRPEYAAPYHWAGFQLQGEPR